MNADRCNYCGRQWPRSEFIAQRQCCKSCNRAYHRRYVAKHITGNGVISAAAWRKQRAEYSKNYRCRLMAARLPYRKERT